MKPYLIKEIITPTKVPVIQEAAPLVEAIDLLDSLHLSALPVARNSELVGVLSKSDIASRKLVNLLTRGKTLQMLFVKELMNTTPPVYIQEDRTALEAARLMYRRNIHRIFVADKKQRLIGTLHTADLIHLMIVD